MTYIKVFNVTPTVELDCNSCKWKLPETCRDCKLSEKLGNVMLSKLHPDKATYKLMRRG